MRTVVRADRRPWEDVVAYSRAVRVGNVIEVSGTAAAQPQGAIISPGDPAAQARECLRIIVDALEQLGATAADVVRTRVFLADPEHWEAVGRAHGEVFRETRPATTFVGAAGFLNPDILVEIEATAIIDRD
jgi:enamine deaminase RidA (YjgF/YER057c/UK114 family)